MIGTQDEPLAVYEWTDTRGLIVRIPAEQRSAPEAPPSRVQRLWRRFEADLFLGALLLLGGFGVGYFLRVFAVT